MPLKTLFLNPPSFENFDGGAGSRWPATREIESFWYPVWLAYPAGMLEGARLLDAPSHHVSGEETIKIAKDYEFLVLFTSTPGFPGDILLARAIKQANPKIKIAFVGPHVTVLPEKSLRDCPAIDFICRKEFDYSVVGLREGQAAGGDSRRLVPEGRKGRAQSRPSADSGSGCAAPRHRSLQARPRRQALQRAVSAASLRVALHHARLPGAVHVLPVAADPERASLAQALHRRRGPLKWPRPSSSGRK